ncbi:glycoside hydrolase family 36 protein [Natronomonas sp. EA1]|uniref:glycoside hydrolase family 36 protein n=1 Tax=Natronomonas sp. EA1 TaxID=3421655 RepID=UPI003EB7BA30
MRATAGAMSVTYDPDSARIRVARDGTRLLAGRLNLVSDASDELVVDLDLTAADGAVDIALTVENRGETPVRLDAVCPFDGAETPFGPTDRVFEHGYQSWSPTATLPLDERFPPETDRSRPQMVDLAAPDDARTSHAVTALTGDPGTLTLGFLEHETSLTRFDLRTDGETTVTATCPFDGVTLAPGETREVPTLRVDASRSVSDALSGIADTVAGRMDARVPERAPTGWCSWYHYFTDVTAEDVRENVARLDDWGVPLDVVQLDDGYEAAFGDWRTLAEGLDDMRALCDDITEAGHTPGLWLAPFYVQADSALVTEHPEWLVTENGEPVDAGARHGPMYALDTTHPGVTEWLTETFETVVDDWGFDYLKLDFLYAAALPGARHENVTRAEAYRQGLRTIREAVGDTFLLGCGAPGFPSVGLVDAMRIGPDTAPYWRRAGESASQPAHENAVRNVLNRQFTHRRLWLSDPDCQLVRTTTDLTTAERESFAALVALLGGANVLSDAVAEIDAPGRRLFERTLPPVHDGRVAGLTGREFPDRVVTERDADGAVAVAAFNWADEPQTVTVDPAAHLEGDAVGWVALGEGAAENRVHEGSIHRTVPAHGVLLVHAAPARDRPHLLGAHHLANAGEHVTATDWDGRTLAVEATEALTLVAATPDRWHSDATDSEPTDETTTLRVTPGTTTFQFSDE